jgi:hypothetical protein
MAVARLLSARGMAKRLENEKMLFFVDATNSLPD